MRTSVSHRSSIGVPHRTGARRHHPCTALVIVAVVLAALLTPRPAGAQGTATIEVPTGALTEIEISDVLNCAVRHIADDQGEFYGDTACATLIATAGTLFGPADIPAGSAAGPRTTFTPVSQSAVSGSGTQGDPHRITTTVDLPGTTLRITQVDSYVAGEESYRTDVTVENVGDLGADGILYRAGDCYLQDSDDGYGRQGPGGAIACVAVDADGTGPGDRVEQWLPLTPGSHSYEAGYSEVWARIGAQQPFDDTCRCDEQIDNGAGLSWSFSLAPSAAATYSHLTTFSPEGRIPLSTAKTAEATPVGPGAPDRYTITVHNPNDEAVTVTEVRDTLPEGFTYTAGTTTGATTTDPQVTGRTLTWDGPLTAPAGGTVTLTFGVTASAVPGTYHNEATALAVDHTVSPTGPTAPVQVVEGDVPRIEGDGVQRVAINLCQFLFTEPDQARTVVLARDDVFADALAGAPLAADDSCILYTAGGPTAALDPATRTELDRALPDGGRVRIMGGTNAVSTAVESELTTAGYVVERFAGPTRYETAEAIARRVVTERPGATEALLAFGERFPDAVTGGAYGAEAGVPIVLTPTAALHPAAQRALTDLGITTTTVLGGPNAISDVAAAAAPGSRRIAGDNRMGTAAAVATTLWPAVLDGPVDQVVITNLDREDGWALTLASAPLSARNDAPQLGVGSDRCPAETAGFLQALDPRASTAFIIGDTSYVSEAVAADIVGDLAS
ncbi:cell wall-binding repeat-containing protein [Euzebya sp.]|uniref:cell wall-binding repeat-containing protein n=1 Tax=Euzebya sp. TaxID=1971409 RepID=UPI00351981B3